MLADVWISYGECAFTPTADRIYEILFFVLLVGHSSSRKHYYVKAWPTIKNSVPENTSLRRFPCWTPKRCFSLHYISSSGVWTTLWKPSVKVLKVSSNCAVSYRISAMQKPTNYTVYVWRQFRNEIELHWIGCVHILQITGLWLAEQEKDKNYTEITEVWYRTTRSYNARCRRKSTHSNTSAFFLGT